MSSDFLGEFSFEKNINVTQKKGFLVKIAFTKVDCFNKIMDNKEVEYAKYCKSVEMTIRDEIGRVRNGFLGLFSIIQDPIKKIKYQIIKKIHNTIQGEIYIGHQINGNNNSNNNNDSNNSDNNSQSYNKVAIKLSLAACIQNGLTRSNNKCYENHINDEIEINKTIINEMRDKEPLFPWLPSMLFYELNIY